MMNIKTALVTVAASIGLVACGQQVEVPAAPAPAPAPKFEPLSLKGYVIGQAATECPERTRESEKGDTYVRDANGPYGITCTYGGGGGSFARFAAEYISVEVANGRIERGNVQLRDIYSNLEVIAVLVQKYGEPHSVNPIEGTMGWEFGEQSLLFQKGLGLGGKYTGASIAFLNEKLPDLFAFRNSDM